MNIRDVLELRIPIVGIRQPRGELDRTLELLFGERDVGPGAQDVRQRAVPPQREWSRERSP
jgi:hypothetical protein